MSFKLTERELAAALKGDASLLITQPEGEAGSEIESVRRIKVSDFLAQLRDMHMLADTAAFVTGTVHGKPALISDGADGLPVKSLVVDIEPVQAGTGDPSPDNVRPINGWTGATIKRFGKNLLEPFSGSSSYTRGTTVDVQSDGTMRAHGTVTTTGSTWLAPIKTVSIKSCGFAEGDTLTISCGPNAALAVRFINSGGTLIRQSTSAAYGSPVTDTIPAGTVSFIYVYQFGTEKVTLGDVVDITTWFQIERGSTFTGFEPYQSDAYEVAFPSSAGTTYGGTLDVITGVLTVDRAMVTIDENTSISISTSSHRAYTNSAVGKPVSGNAVVSDTLISDYLPTVSVNAIYISNITGVAISNTGTLNFNIPGVTNGDSFTVNDVKTYLASHNLHAVCGIEAVTYQLTPLEILTLLGTNTIFADCGDVSVTYRADPTLYINRKIAEALQTCLAAHTETNNLTLSSAE